jgi:pimeloyl-ACP methyl ester carboxylesterase
MKRNIEDRIVAVPGEKTTTGKALEFEVVSFGDGADHLVIVPGLSDGLTTVGGKGKLLAWYYRKLPGRYRIHVISRPRNLPDEYTTREMAADYAALFDVVGIPGDRLDVWGVSQGGMISQWLAVDHRDSLRAVCLTVTTPGQTPTLQSVVHNWIEQQKRGAHGDFMRHSVRKTYSSKSLWKYAPMWPFFGLVNRPKDIRRFVVQAESCLSHEAREFLPSISLPVFVLGGGSDEIVGPGTSEELAGLIPGCESHTYPELGHGAFEEANDATEIVMDFFARKAG